MKSAISVIIPTYNRSEFLIDALQSINAQTLKPLEIIVVDDGSTDNTHAVVLESNFEVKYIYQKNSGPAASRNAGVRAAAGNVITFLDDDDILLPKALELLTGRIESNVSFQPDIVFGLTMPAKNIKKAKDIFTYDVIPPAWPEHLIGGSVISAKTMDKIGFFDETLALGQDLDWYMRAKEKNVRFDFISEITHVYRLHNNNRTKQVGESKKFMLKVLKKSLLRREKVNKVALPLGF